MKTLLTMASSLALAALLLPAQAQTPATTHDNPSPAKPKAKPTTQRGTAYKQGADTSAKQTTMGRKFMEKSKPTGSRAPNQPHTPIQ
jgi:hypothetical protein